MEGLLRVVSGGRGGARGRAEGLLGSSDDGLVRDVAGGGEDEVRADVVRSVVGLDVLLGDVGEVLSDSLDRLSEEVVSVGGVVHSLDGGSLLVPRESEGGNAKR